MRDRRLDSVRSNSPRNPSIVARSATDAQNIQASAQRLTYVMAQRVILGASSSDMLSEYATEYREIAERCMGLAAAAWHAEAKTAWLALAERWQQLALLADKYAAEEPRRNSSRNASPALRN